MDKVVLYVGRFSLPYGTAAAQRVSVNKKAIEKAGYKVKFVSTYENDLEYFNIDNDFNINNINSKKYLYDISFMKEIIENSHDKIHAVIFYNFPSISLWRLSKYLKEKGIKVLADCTEWYSVPQSKNILRNLIKYLDTEFRMRLVHKKTDGVICISTYLESYYSSNKIKTILIPNLLDLQDVKWQHDDNENQKDQNLIMVYAGNPGENFEKENLDTLVDIFSEISISGKKIDLKVIGISKDDFIKIYYKKHAKKPILNNIIFIGRKPHFEVIRVVQSSDYFIFFRPMTKANIAGFPTKLVEAFGSVTPTITNNVGDVEKYLKNGVNGYLVNSVAPFNLKQDLEAILKQHNHNSYAFQKHKLRENNPFDYNLYIEEFLKILK